MTLHKELSRAAHASTVQGREALEDAHETDSHFDRKLFFHFVLNFSSLLLTPLILLRTPPPAPGLFPEKWEAAEMVVEVSREERRSTGQEVDATAGWSVEELGMGLRARLLVLVESLERL